MGRRIVVVTIIFAAIVAVTNAPGYGFSLSQMLGSGEEQNLNTFKVIHVADLKALLDKRGDNVHVFDANIDVTRERFGVIPGATLLTSDQNYPLSVLPPNRHATLIFYCADRH